jgi:predicted dehydrogenase
MSKLKITKNYRLKGCVVGLSKFIGRHHMSAARGIISPRVDIDVCVPGTPKNFRANKQMALEMGFLEEHVHESLTSALSENESTVVPLIDFVLIATPNHVHAEQCIAASQNGRHIVCDKPLARTAAEADSIVDEINVDKVETCITATYCGHSAVIEARHRVGQWLNSGRRLLRGHGSYLQRWLRKKLADMAVDEGRNQADWRKDPEKSGEGGATGDILSHLIFELIFITGLKVSRVRAKRDTVIEGPGSNTTDDDVHAILLMENGAEVTLEACQFAGGHQNDNMIELQFADGYAIRWDVRESEYLWVAEGGPFVRLTRDDFKSPIHGLTNTMPALHIDGWHDADARLITSFAWKVLNSEVKRPYLPTEYFHLTALDARNVNAVIDTIITSADHPGGPFSEAIVDWRKD